MILLKRREGFNLKNSRIIDISQVDRLDLLLKTGYH